MSDPTRKTPVPVVVSGYSRQSYVRRPVRPGRRFGRRLLVGLVTLIILAGAAVLFWPSGSQEASDKTVATAAPKPVQNLDFSQFDQQVDQIIQTHPGMDIGVAVVDIKTGQAKSYGVQDPFEAASTAKLLTAIAFLHDVEQGKLSLEQQVGGQSAQAALEKLIVHSDNQAWYDLNNVVMSHAELAAYANQIGFVQYDPDANTVVPASLATLLNNLYQQRLLNESHTNLLLSYMQRAEEVDYVTSIVPSGVKVYHKPGYLKDRVHDALIIDNGERPYVLVIFTKSRTVSYDGDAGLAIFQGIARASFSTFMPDQTTTTP